MGRNVRTLLALCLALGTGAGLSEAGEGSVWVEAARDNTLIESSDGSLSNGRGPAFFAGNNSQDASRRGVIAFDLAGHIPAGARITGVRLVLFMSQTSGGAATVALHRVSAPWGEGESSTGGGGGAPSEDGDATWIHNVYDGGFWAAPGSDFVASSASAVVDQPGVYMFGPTPGLAADVRSWLADPPTNHGWLVRGDESGATTAKRFHSRENPDVDTRPLLIVNYETPAHDGDDDDDDDDDDESHGEPHFVRRPAR